MLETTYGVSRIFLPVTLWAQGLLATVKAIEPFDQFI
jgi:hypothetical protein